MAYVIKKVHTKKECLSYLPEVILLPKINEKAILDFYRASDYETVYEMLKDAVDEGQTYPQETMEKEDFENYYLSHDVFVLRNSKNEEVLGSFYIKPNFPGRSSHICNAGFLVHKNHRNKGIGEILYKQYLPMARDLGYEGSFFNLVYATNYASIKICQKLGFTEIGRIPKVGKMKGLGDVDGLQFYYDLTTLEPRDM